MANVSFAEVDLSTLGLSVYELNGRGLTSWISQRVEILGREETADVGGRYDPATQTSISGGLSDDVPYLSHPQLLTNLDTLKDLLDPASGYQRLVITGDRATHFRWCRFASMDYQEARPVFKLPFQRISLVFDNLEPFWRVVHAAVSGSGIPLALPNPGKPSRPVIRLTVTGPITATSSGGVVTPVDLFTIDDLVVQWKGLTTEDGDLQSGDTVDIDGDAMTVTINEPTDPVDATRNYTASGAGRADNSSFPIIAAGGSYITSKHANVSTISVSYDERYL